MIEFWLVVRQPKPVPIREGVPVRKSSLNRSEVIMRCNTEAKAVEEAIKWSKNNPTYIYVVMHSIAAFGVKDPEPAELEIEKVPASMLPDPPKDDEEDEEEDDPWDDEEEDE